MMKQVLMACAAAMLCGCHESLEERAAREAREYTGKHCPTPIVNYTRTDSVTFDRAIRTYTYHETFFDVLDDSILVAAVRDDLHETLVTTLRNNPKAKTEREAGFSFAYVARSATRPQVVLFNDTVGPGNWQ